MGSLYRRGNIWWIKYYRNGRPIRESTGTDKQTEAKRFLKLREGDVAQGRLVIPRVERIRFEELAEDFLNDYQINGRRSLDKARRSVRHLSKYFGGCRITNITTANIRGPRMLPTASSCRSVRTLSTWLPMSRTVVTPLAR